jgi:hypothetical protein
VKVPPEADPAPWFEDATGELGIDFVQDAGPVDDRYFMPQIVGSGVAVFDFDGDGLLDLYFLNNGGPKGKRNRLYKQLPSGKFKDVSRGSGLDFAGHCMGVAVGDVNNDGKPDVLVTLYTGVRLFLNNGDGTFTDVTVQAGLVNPLWATSAAFVDYDRDGRLDLIVTSYVAYDPSQGCKNPSGEGDYCAPKTFRGTSSKLFKNVTQPGGPVKFLDVSFESGIGRKPGPGLGVVCADFNGDGWPDVFIANDGLPNHLWINQKDGTFKEEAVARGLAYNAMGQAEANMGIGWGDVDGDGLQDVFVTHLASETNTVWKQGPRGLFRDQTIHSGMHRPRWRATGFGTVLADFDQDGWLDAAIANGAVDKSPPTPDSPLGPFWGRYAQRNQLFANDGQGRFRDLSPFNAPLCGVANIGRGLAVADLDNKGPLWLIVTSVAGKARLFRNVAPDRGHWLGVRCLEPGSKRDALGAEVTVRAGGRAWVRTLQSAGSYLCSNDPRAHFGLGRAERYDAVEVIWPDGSKERFPGGAVDRHVRLIRGEGKALP